MAKPTRESDSNGTTTTTDSYTVFIDTSLDTHLAMIVSDSDTVSELKKKIMLEHPQCFPRIGEIKIHALKVKRKGYFYHLSDSMLVKSAFEGAKRNWFLSVDASSPKGQTVNLNRGPDTTNPPAFDGKTKCPSGDRNNLIAYNLSNRLSIIDEPSFHENLKVSCGDLSVPVYSCEKVSKDLEMEAKHTTDDHLIYSSYTANEIRDRDIQEKYDILEEENKAPETIHKDKENNISLQENSQGGHTAKKKHERGNKDEADSSLRENRALVSEFGKETSNQETVIPHNTEDHLKYSFSAAYEMLDHDIQEKHDILGEENKAPETNHKLMENNMSLQENSQVGHTAKKKRKRGMKNEVDTSLIENRALVSDFVKEICNPETLIPQSTDDHLEYSSCAANELPDHDIQEKHDVLDEENKAPETNHKHMENNMSLQENSQVGRTAKKKRKRGKTNEVDTSLIENRALVSDFVKEICNPETLIPQSTDDHLEYSSCAANEMPDHDIQEKHDVLGEEDKAPETNHKLKDNNISLQENSQGGHTAKKRRKRGNKNVVDTSFRENRALVFGKETSNPETVIPQSANANIKYPSSVVKEIPDHDIQEKHDIFGEEKQVPETNHEEKNMSLQENSEGGHTGRKKREVENRGEAVTSLRENRALVSDSEKETCKPDTVIPQNSVVDKQKTTNATADVLLTRHLEDVQFIHSGTSGGHVLVTKPLEGVELLHSSTSDGKKKRKRKKKSSKHCDQIVSDVLFSLQNDGELTLNEDGKFDPRDLGGVSDVNEEGKFKPKNLGRESDAAIISGGSSCQAEFSEHLGVPPKEKHVEPVQEAVEGNTAHCSSADIKVSVHDNANIEAKKDLPAVFDGSGVKGSKNSKKRRAGAKGVSSLTTDVTQTGPENVVPADQTVDNEQTNKIEEERRMSLNHEPAVMVSEKPKPLNLGEDGVNTREAVVTANILSDANVGLESGKTAGKRRKKKRAKKPVAGLQFSSEAEHDNYSISRTIHSSQAPSPQTLETDLKGKPHKSNVDNHVPESESINDANIHKEESGMKGDKINFKDYFVHATDSHEVAPAEVPVDKVNKERRSDQNLNVKKNTKNSKHSLGDENKSHVVNSSSVQIQDSSSVRVHQSISKYEHSGVMTRSQKMSPKVSANGLRSPQSLNVDQIKPITQESRRLNVVGGSGIKSSNGVVKTTSSSSSESSDSSVQNKRDNKNQSSANRHNATVVKALSKNTGKVDSRRLNVVNGSGIKSSNGVAKATSSSSLESSDRSVQNKRDNENQSGAHRQKATVGKAMGNNSGEVDSRGLNFGNGSWIKSSNGVAKATSSSSSESSDGFMQNKRDNKNQSSANHPNTALVKALSKNTGKVETSALCRTSLLTTPGSIFRDGSSESSEDEKGDANSDASTRTPSDNSSSSGDSEDEGNSSSYGAKWKQGDRKNILRLTSSGPKNMTMQMILKNSSRFKKAKLTASQSQLEDTEFVPDSQPNL